VTLSDFGVASGASGVTLSDFGVTSEASGVAGAIALSSIFSILGSSTVGSLNPLSIIIYSHSSNFLKFAP